MITEAFVPPKPKEFDRTVRRPPGWELIRDDVQIQSGISAPEVDVRRQKLILQRENADDRLDRAGRA